MKRCYFFVVGMMSLVAAVPAFCDTPVDLSHATLVNLPSSGAFKTSDGKEGWVRRLSGEAIPTPAFAKGRIYTGTGMSAATFMALDAGSGETIWQQSTSDNGPTSPVVSDKYVCYNTESCDTESRDLESGNLIWRETTGGSLMTQPVIAGNMLIIPHPTMARASVMADDAFRVLGVDLATGAHRWDKNMTADVLAAPIADPGHIFFTCTDGRVFCIDLVGTRSWHVVAKAISAPVVVGDTLAVTTDEGDGKSISVRRYAVKDGTLLDGKPLATIAVGAAVVGPGQRAGWDYQGPKIAANGSHLFHAAGATLLSLDIATGKNLWTAPVRAEGVFNTANVLTPPALGKKNLYVGTARGQIFALNQSDGTLAFAYNLNQPLASQPILAEGNLYIGTANGLLICLKLNNPDADNWTAWGGDSNHNKVN